MGRSYTTAFDASRKIYTLLNAASGWGQATVSWGYPGDSAGAEIVWVGGIEGGEQTTQSLGQRARDESYTVAVYVDVAQRTRDPYDVNERAAELVRHVEEIVHDSPTLDGVVNKWAVVDGVDTIVEAQPVTDTAYGTVVRVRVACQSRI